MAGPLCADTWHVDAAAKPSGADGADWDTAFPLLQDALAKAGPGDEIRIAKGVYRPDEGASQSDNDPTESFVFPDGATVLAGYETGESNPGRDPLQFLTILSGDIGKDDTDTDGNQIAESPADQAGTNAEHVVSIKPGTSQIILDGLVITAGETGGSGQSGGGLIVDDAPVSIRNCRFSGNQSTGRGGALHLNDNTSTVRNCYFTGNGTSARGGAVGTRNGNSATFTNCAFLGNLAQRGGAVNLNTGTAFFINTSFSGNSGTINGGGIQAANNATFTVRNSVIWNNHAAGARNLAGSSINLLSGAGSTIQNCNIENSGGVDPLFQQPPNPASAPSSTGDLRLTPASPLVDAGTAYDTIGNDLAGEARVAGSTIDRGAYERQPGDLYVDPGAPGTNTGESWANAFQNLPAALAAAIAGDGIHVSSNLYVPATAADSFLLPLEVTLTGGYPPAGVGPRDPLANPTILSGDVGGDDTNTDGNLIAEAALQQVGNNATTILKPASGVTLTASTIIDGFIFTAGQADLPNTPTDPSITRAGAAYLGDGSPWFRNCRFLGNRAREGGAVTSSGSPRFTDCEFSGNETIAFGEGGAARFESGNPLFERCTFESNRSTTGNSIKGHGGAVYGRLANITFDRCIFRANQAWHNGSVFYSETSGTTRFNNCLLSGNQADINSGAIYIHGGLVILDNCTVSGNAGGGIRQFGGASGIANSILWNNSDHNLLHTGGSLPSVRYSLVEGSSHGTTGFYACLDGTNPNNDPDFSSAISPLSAPTTSGNYRLPSHSPVISEGEDASAPTGPDLDNNTRISGHTVDLGCYEFQLVDTDSDGLSDSFELANTAPPSATSLDPASNTDGDPFDALQEFALGLDPDSPDAWHDVHRTDFSDGLGIFLYFPLDPTAKHYVKVTGEWSYTLLPGSWMESAIYSDGNFGTLPGEFAARAPNLPSDTRGFVRLRFEP